MPKHLTPRKRDIVDHPADCKELVEAGKQHKSIDETMKLWTGVRKGTRTAHYAREIGGMGNANSGGKVVVMTAGQDC
jgi:hypothetical protein